MKLQTLRICARTFSVASQKVRPDPHLSYDFVQATEKDLNQMVDMCCSDFLRIEPHARALGLTPEESRYLFEWIVGKAVHYPYSLKVLEKKTGKLVGIRTLTVGHRNHSLDWEPFKIDETKITPRLGKLASILDESKQNFWRIVDPKVNKVMRREITFISADHQRKGIARTMVELNLDFNQMRKEGIQGIVSEASSLANQTLLASVGYKCVYEPKNYDWAKKIDDGTTGVKVFFKDLRL